MVSLSRFASSIFPGQLVYRLVLKRKLVGKAFYCCFDVEVVVLCRLVRRKDVSFEVDMNSTLDFGGG